MKKKILSATLLLGFTLAFTGCAGEEEDLFDKSAAERLKESKATYTERFAAASAGWAIEYYPTNGSSAPRGQGYLMLVKFNADGSVRIAMQNDMTNNRYVEDTSLWEMIADQGPVLSFNSYNQCLHLFSNPAIYETGLGYEGDYEFEVIDLQENAEYATLKGKKRGTYIRLTRLEEGTDFEEYLKEINNFKNTIFSASAPTDNMLNIGEKKYVVTNANSGILDLYPYGGDAITETTSHPFLITKHNGEFHLRFRSAIERDSLEENIQELIYNELQDKFIDTNDNDINIEGWSIGDFFEEYSRSTSIWTSDTSSASETYKKYMRELAESFANMKDAKKRSYTFNGATFSLNVRIKDNVRDSVFTWGISYKAPGSSTSTTAYYDFDVKFENNTVTFNYIKPKDDAAANIAKTFETINNLTRELSQKFVITSATGTNFNLRRLRLTAEKDSNMWLTLYIL